MDNSTTNPTARAIVRGKQIGTHMPGVYEMTHEHQDSEGTYWPRGTLYSPLSSGRANDRDITVEGKDGLRTVRRLYQDISIKGQTVRFYKEA